MNQFLHKLLSFVDKDRPIVAGIATGLYPVIIYYTYNYTLVNSWEQLLFFGIVFQLLPCIIALIVYKISRRTAFVKWREPLLVLFSLFVFLVFVEIGLHAELKKKLALLTLVVCVPISLLLRKYLSKIILLQYVIALVGLFSLVPALVENWSISSEWKVQPDHIIATQFKTFPNVYYIQPDGYTNFSEIKKGHYVHDNTSFEHFLQVNGFKNYDNFRSNYTSTLASNASMFSMKHHFYNGKTNPHESVEARKNVISENPVLTIFKNNGYATHCITETPYLLLNHPKMGFDSCNFSPAEIPLIGKGFRRRKSVVTDFKKRMTQLDSTPNFFFIEFIAPGHIQDGGTAEGEKKKWLNNLKNANRTLQDLVSTIKRTDPNGLIIILADHGGYVGFEKASDIYKKTMRRDDVYSIFSSQLSIHWPENTPPSYDDKLRTSVNMFRTVFAYLAKDSTLMEVLQDDISFVTIRKGGEKGVFQYIDADGTVGWKQNEIERD